MMLFVRLFTIRSVRTVLCGLVSPKSGFTRVIRSNSFHANVAQKLDERAQ